MQQQETPLSPADRALITDAGYDPNDERERELGQMALHCARLFFESGTVKGSPPNRNSPCPCGSGKKYKKCCQASDEAAASAPRPTLELGHIPQIFNDDAMDADQDRLFHLLSNEPTLRYIRYDLATLNPFIAAGLPDDEAALDAEAWTDLMTELAQQFHVTHADDLDVVGALLACGRTGQRDMPTLRALANGVLHLALAEMSDQPEMNLVAAEILRATVDDAEAAGTPMPAFDDDDDDDDGDGS